MWVEARLPHPHRHLDLPLSNDVPRNSLMVVILAKPRAGEKEASATLSPGSFPPT